MATTIHSTVHNQAGAVVEIRTDGTWPKDQSFSWYCNGCKSDGFNGPHTQRLAQEHADKCRLN